HASSDNGALRRRAEDDPRSLEGPTCPGEAGERREPDCERSPGDRSQGNGGLFGLFGFAERDRSVFPRRSNGFHPWSQATRVRQAEPTRFDRLPVTPAVNEP